MNETLEERLREAMERRAADLPVPMSPPARLVRRTRRRQVAVGTVAGLAAVVVVMSSFLGVRELWTRSQTPGGGTTQTSQVDGVTVSYPAGWHFENTLEQSGAESQVLFIVANYSPPSSFISLPDNQVCRADAAVMAVQDTTARPVMGPRALPKWPVPLKPDQVDVQGCGVAETAAWTAADRNFEAIVLLGKNVSSEDRAAIVSAFKGLRFGPATHPVGKGKGSGPVSAGPGTVIARGTTAGQAWTVSVDGTGNGVTVSAETEGQGIGIGLAQSPSGRTATLSAAALRLGTGQRAPRVVFGLASAKVSSVHMEPTHEIATLYPIPGSTRQQVFVMVVTSVRAGATVVAEDEGGKNLDQQPLGRGVAIPSPNESPPSPTPTP